MSFITIITVIALIVMAGFHFYWVFGGKIGLDKALPSRDGELLLKPSKAMTFLVGVILLLFAYIAFALGFYDFDTIENKSFYQYFGVFLSIIFTLRAIGEFNVVGFFKKVKDTPFAIYDTRYYSPLCLILGFIFALLVYNI